MKMSLLQKISVAFKHMSGVEQFLFTGCLLAMVANVGMIGIVIHMVGVNAEVVGLALVNMLFLSIGAYAQYNNGKKRFHNQNGDIDEHV